MDLYVEVFRLNRIRAFVQEAGLREGEGVYVTKPSNMFYLTGFTGEGVLAITPRDAAIITDFRYTEQAGRQAPGVRVEMIRKGVDHEALAWKLFSASGVSRVFIEDDHVTVRQCEHLKETMTGAALQPLCGIPEKMRAVKDADEIACIRRACAISCEAFARLLPKLKPGMTEKQVRLKLDYTMMELGSERLAFDTIAAAGENGSLPHAVPSDHPIAPGEMLTLDFGARHRGYDADMTRTVSFGEPSPEMRRIYETVLRAHLECEEMLRPGVECCAVDRHARDVIDAAGYGSRFGHSLGHGVGIDIHENPRLSMTGDAILCPGHIVTVEPGIYVPGLGGVRIEDTCVITETGYESLVTAPKELIIL